MDKRDGLILGQDFISWLEIRRWGVSWLEIRRWGVENGFADPGDPFEKYDAAVLHGEGSFEPWAVLLNAWLEHRKTLEWMATTNVGKLDLAGPAVERLAITEAQVRAGVEAYDRARVASHGQKYGERTAMSERNKETIAPMIRAAIEAALAAGGER